jgi:hypothetical protein
MRRVRKKITQKDRKIWRRNALKGTRKWQRMSHKQRLRRIRASQWVGHGWGFSGKSPHTRPRRYRRHR